jgi:small-conductance mechanosensitive channel
MKPFMQQIRLGKIIGQALFVPALLLIAGLGLVNIHLFLNKTSDLHQIIAIANITGQVFMAVAWVLFIYSVVASLLKIYRLSLNSQTQATQIHVLNIIQTGLKLIFTFFTFRAIVTVLNINPQEVDILRKVISLFMIAVIAWLLLQIISTLEMVAYQKYSKPHAHVNEANNYTRIHLIRNISVILVFVFSTAAALMLFDGVRNIGISLLASAGFLTAILGLAAQKSLGLLFSGVQFAFAQPFQIGDIITVENETGTIEEITMLYVKLKTANGQQFTLPIDYFLQKPFRNWSYYNEGIQGEIKQSISANFPLQLIRDELTKIANDSKDGNKALRAITVADFTENNIELRITISADNLSTLDKFKASIREKLFEFTRTNDFTTEKNNR